MIHEILFSLWHCPSGLFKLNDKLEWINSVELINFLHPGETRILENIIRIAACYHKFEDFRNRIDFESTAQDQNSVTVTEDAQAVINEPEKSEATLHCGFYMRAFCRGLDEVLEDYRKTILKLEVTLMDNPQLTLMYVLGAMDKYTTLFEYIESIIETMETEKMYGCHLVGRLHKYGNCGIPEVSNAVQIIIKAVNTTFYKQLADWCVYGDLTDMYDEFFIIDCKCDDENFLYPEQTETEFENIASSQRKNSFVKRPCRVRKFMIKPEMLPSMVPHDLAQSILFMGRIVWIVRNDPSQNQATLQDKFRRDAWEERSWEYYKKIQNLEEHPFSLRRFEPTIQECTHKLTRYLWNIMVEEAGLLNYLQVIRDYYALGRGEHFQQFIILAEELIEQTPSRSISKNINALFNDIARKIYGDKDRSYQKIDIMIAPNLAPGSNPLLNMEIHIEIPWPLHIIFHPKAVSLYNTLFAFLIRIKKTSIDLHLLWNNHVQSKMKISQGLWRLRHNLIFLINNLEYYLQVDVIESHFSLLRQGFHNTGGINDILRMHSAFLGDILRKTFVMSLDEESKHDRRYSLYHVPAIKTVRRNKVYDIIILLLQLCDEFCLFANKWTGELGEPQRNELQSFQTRSDAIIEMLLRALFSMHEKVSGHHLLQLLHRLDFNHWFTKNKPDLNLTET